nr:hypothetical protein HAGR004_19590 [Bdellovibrio sp. HAGR004]
MKNLILANILFFALAPLQSIAGSTWANCPGDYGTSVQEVFWKSDVDGGSGPDYHLKSGQTLSNAGSVCQPGPILKPEEWTQQLKTDLNPVKTVKSFKAVKSPEELQKFLREFGVKIDDEERLNEAVKAYLAGKQITNTEPKPSASISNPAILVGRSNQQALIALATSDGKTRSAVFLALKHESFEQ